MSWIWKVSSTRPWPVSEDSDSSVTRWANAARSRMICSTVREPTIERSEPGFLCHALIPKSAVQEAETDELINKIYDGSADKLFAALLGRKKLSAEQIAQLKKIVGELE